MNKGENTPTITGLSAGNFSVTVTDNRAVLLHLTKFYPTRTHERFNYYLRNS